MAETTVTTATATIDAPAEVIFEQIADPARQIAWDGNDNLAESAEGQRVRAVGDVFVTITTKGNERHNHVVELEEGRRIAWCPAEPGGEPLGHLWRWEVRPVGDGRSEVTHTYDWTHLTDEQRFERARSTTTERLQASLERLAQVCEQPSR